MSYRGGKLIYDRCFLFHPIVLIEVGIVRFLSKATIATRKHICFFYKYIYYVCSVLVQISKLYEEYINVI